MKPLQLALVVLSLSAAVAHAQSAPQDDVTKQATNEVEATQPAGRVSRRAVEPARKDDPDTCVGPVSFCNVYIGS